VSDEPGTREHASRDFSGKVIWVAEGWWLSWTLVVAMRVGLTLVLSSEAQTPSDGIGAGKISKP